MVGHLVLVQAIGVQIPVSEPNFAPSGLRLTGQPTLGLRLTGLSDEARRA